MHNYLNPTISNTNGNFEVFEDGIMLDMTSAFEPKIKDWHFNYAMNGIFYEKSA